MSRARDTLINTVSFERLRAVTGWRGPSETRPAAFAPVVGLDRQKKHENIMRDTAAAFVRKRKKNGYNASIRISRVITHTRVILSSPAGDLNALHPTAHTRTIPGAIHNASYK